LQVALVARWQPFQRRQQAEQGPGNASGFSAQQFPGVGVFLLRHEAAARGVFIKENHVGKLLGCKNHEVFRKPGEERGESSEREKIIERKIAIADSIKAVCRYTRETQFAG